MEVKSQGLAVIDSGGIDDWKRLDRFVGEESWSASGDNDNDDGGVEILARRVLWFEKDLLVREFAVLNCRDLSDASSDLEDPSLVCSLEGSESRPKKSAFSRAFRSSRSSGDRKLESESLVEHC